MQNGKGVRFIPRAGQEIFFAKAGIKMREAPAVRTCRFIWASRLKLESIYEPILFVAQVRGPCTQCSAPEDVLRHQSHNGCIGLVRVCSCGHRTERQPSICKVQTRDDAQGRPEDHGGGNLERQGETMLLARVQQMGRVCLCGQGIRHDKRKRALCSFSQWPDCKGHWHSEVLSRATCNERRQATRAICA